MSEQKDAYVSDAPIDDPNGDKFNRQPFAQRIADTIACRKDPSSIVLGIYGAWGEGKTTVLNFIAKALDSKQAVTCLRYNPWRFATEEQMLIGFFDELAQSIDASLRTHVEKIAKWLGRREHLAGTFFGRAQAAVKALGGKGNVSLEKLRQRLEDALIKKKTRIVVLIDDIDRLDRGEIQAVFRLVKLTADFKNVAYVLAFDHGLVARALGERYGDGGAPAGAQFLEKIIQVPLDLPRADQMSLVNYALACINEAVAGSGVELTPQQEEEFGLQFERSILGALRTPRMCKRYGNALAFALPILKDEVSPVDLMIVEAIRTLYPTLYKFIRTSKDLIFAQVGWSRDDDTEVKDAITTAVDQAMRDFTSHDQDAAKALIRSLFPVIAHVFGGAQYADGFSDKWISEQRVTTRQYFDRYFSYAIPPNDIPDRLIQELIATVPDKSVDDLHVELKKLLERYRPDALIGTLRLYEDTVPCKSGVRLALAVAAIGDGWPDPDQLFGMTGPFGQAAIFAANMIRKTADSAQRVEHAKAVIDKAGSASFAYDFYWWTIPRKDDQGFDESDAEREIADLGNALAGRIKREAFEQQLVEQCPTKLRQLLRVWRAYGDKDECRLHVEGLISKDQSFATRFLGAFRRTAWAGGVKASPVFERSDYDSVVDSVDADVMLAALRATYGEEMPTESAKFENDEEWVAHQFRRIHNAVTASQGGDAESDQGQGVLAGSSGESPSQSQESSKQSNDVSAPSGDVSEPSG